MPKKDNQTDNIQHQFSAKPNNVPINIADILAETGEAAELIPAENLKDKTFHIVRMNRFRSRFEAQDYAYHCVCSEVLGEDFFRTVLGGEAVIKHLNLICELGITNPIRVTLRYVEGGRYGGYYVLE